LELRAMLLAADGMLYLKASEEITPLRLRMKRISKHGTFDLGKRGTLVSIIEGETACPV